MEGALNNYGYSLLTVLGCCLGRPSTGGKHWKQLQQLPLVPSQSAQSPKLAGKARPGENFDTRTS